MLGTISKQYARLNVKRMDFGLFVGDRYCGEVGAGGKAL
jgi:hypothetical protein